MLAFSVLSYRLGRFLKGIMTVLFFVGLCLFNWFKDCESLAANLGADQDDSEKSKRCYKPRGVQEKC